MLLETHLCILMSEVKKKHWHKWDMFVIACVNWDAFETNEIHLLAQLGATGKNFVKHGLTKLLRIRHTLVGKLMRWIST